MAKISTKNVPKAAEKRSSLLPAPRLPYLPRDPKRYDPAIALIGCGGISKWHLTAYRSAKYNIAVLCDIDKQRANERRDEFFPDAEVSDDWRSVLSRSDVEVVDITTHPPERPPIIENALRARKHVLSQKPYVLDLDVGERLADLADEMGVRLAINQNGRWAPHFSYIREAVRSGLVGSVSAVHCGVHWDHSWVRGTPFEHVRHLILYDFAIHWFDFLTTVLSDQPPQRVYATMSWSATQTVMPPLLAEAMVQYPAAQASLVFDGHTPHGRLDRVFVAGSEGTISSVGPNSEKQTVELTTKEGVSRPRLRGCWFPDGFHGTMAELLCAIEEKREPSNSARNNLSSLALCFAAVESAERGIPVLPGEVRKLPVAGHDL